MPVFATIGSLISCVDIFFFFKKKKENTAINTNITLNVNISDTLVYNCSP